MWKSAIFDVNRVVSEKEISIPAKDFRPAVILQNCQFQLIRKKKKLHFALQLNLGRVLELYFIMRRCRRENVFSRGTKAIHKKQEKPKEGFQWICHSLLSEFRFVIIFVTFYKGKNRSNSKKLHPDLDSKNCAFSHRFSIWMNFWL